MSTVHAYTAASMVMVCPRAIDVGALVNLSGWGPRPQLLLTMIKQNGDQIVSLSRWRRKHLYSLQLWLPAVVVESDRRLGYVLLHAEDTKGTGWEPDWLTQDEALAFLSLLERDFPDDPRGYDIFSALRKRAAL